MLSEPGVVLSSPGGLAARCACEDMAENQWLSSKSIGLSLVADMISVCVGGSSFPLSGLTGLVAGFPKGSPIS